MLPGLCALPHSNSEAAFSVGQTENLRGERGLQFALVSWTILVPQSRGGSKFYVLKDQFTKLTRRLLHPNSTVNCQLSPFLSLSAGIIKGDEIMVINGAIVSDLDMMFIESVLQEEISLCMMMRSCRTGE